MDRSCRVMGPSRGVFDPPSAASGHGHMFLPNTTTGGLSFGGYGTSGMGGGCRGPKRRPFFSSPEELILDDDCYDELLLPEKKRRLTPEQVQLLERSFEAEKKLEPERKAELANNLGLRPRQVAVWFQNRRARWKNKQLEHDFDHLKSLYNALLVDHDSLVSNHDSLLTDNQRLRSEVMSLTEKLKAKGGASGGPQQPPEEAMAEVVVAQAGMETKAEDQLSTGTGVLDAEKYVDDVPPPPVVDGGETYNYAAVVEDGDNHHHGACGYVVQLEEDNGAYFEGSGFAGDYAGVDQLELCEVGSGWWVWS